MKSSITLHFCITDPMDLKLCFLDFSMVIVSDFQVKIMWTFWSHKMYIQDHQVYMIYRVVHILYIDDIYLYGNLKHILES